MVLWQTQADHWHVSDSGTNARSHHSLEVHGVPIDGELLGGKIEKSPPEGLNEEVTWKSMPKLAYNKFKNEYMIAYMIGYTYNNPKYPSDPLYWTYYNVIERVRINNMGEVRGDGPAVFWPTTWNASHTAIAFNSKRQEYLVVYNDKYIFTNDVNIYDQPGFILDAEGNVISGDPIGSPIKVDSETGHISAPMLSIIRQMTPICLIGKTSGMSPRVNPGCTALMIFTVHC